MPETTGIDRNRNEEMAGNEGGSRPDPVEAMKENLRRQRAEWAKKETSGQRFLIPREGKKSVDAILYRPADCERKDLPVLFNMHGGAWIGGDAVLMESFCQLMADKIPALVVNLNYTKADVEPITYALKEVTDAVKYFGANSEVFGIDAGKMAVGGHSAGAHLACSAALALANEGVQLAAQMLVYPVANLDRDDDLMKMLRGLRPDSSWDDPVLSPLNAPDEQLKNLGPALFILCGKDDLRPDGIAYAKRLIDLAVSVKVKEYKEAEHGFLEVNRPDYGTGDPRQTPEQAAYCRDCEQYLIRELGAMLI